MFSQRIFAGSLVAASLGCQPASTEKEGAKVAALEDLAGNTSVDGDNACTGTNTVKIHDANIAIEGVDVAGKAAALTAVHSYLTAIPIDVQDAFVKLNGRILITDKAPTLCASGSDNPQTPGYVGGARHIQGCFIFKKSAAGKDVFTIVHSPDPAGIAHSGVRIFGFLWAQFYTRLTAGAGSSGKYSLKNQEAPSAARAKFHLANRFLRDVASSTKFGLTSLEPLLGSGAAAIITGNVIGKVETADAFDGVTFAYADDPTAWTNAQKDSARSLRRQRFVDYVYADAFDSLHCNAATQKTIREDFEKTYAAFLPIDATIAAMAKAINSGNARSSLGLVDQPDDHVYEDYAYPMPDGSTVPIGYDGHFDPLTSDQGTGFFDQFASTAWDSSVGTEGSYNSANPSPASEIFGTSSDMLGGVTSAKTDLYGSAGDGEFTTFLNEVFGLAH